MGSFAMCLIKVEVLVLKIGLAQVLCRIDDGGIRNEVGYVDGEKTGNRNATLAALSVQLAKKLTGPSIVGAA